MESIEGASRYKVQRPLGQGAMGQVLLAEDTELGREVAIKVIPRHLVEREDIRARFEREALLQASLTHPNIVRVFDCRLDISSPYLVMEYIDGADLGAVVERDGPLEVYPALRMVRELCDALDALHEQGALHRDIKPSNIMVRRADGGAVLMDLGLASFGDSNLTKTGTVVGTPRYLPPEVIQGEEWSPAGDRYQLGVVLYETLTGQPMVPGNTLTEVVAAAMTGGRNPLPEGITVPDAVYESMMRAVAVEPEDRFASGREMAEALIPATVSDEVDRSTLLDRAALRSAVMPVMGDTEVGRPVSSARSTTGPAPGPTTPRSRGAWATAVLGGGMLAGFGLALAVRALAPGPPGAREVRARVVGDSVEVSALADGVAGATVLVDGRAIPAAGERIGARTRWVATGLTPGREAEVVLSWPGGRSAPQVVTPEESAVRPDLQLTRRGQVRLEVVRPISARWLEAGRAQALEPGEVLLRPPSRGPWTLTWEEGGVPARRSWDRDRVFHQTIAALADQLAVIPLPDNPRWNNLAPFVQGEVPEALRAWKRIESWIPDVLSSDLPPPIRRGFWDGWQLWYRSSRVIRLLRPFDFKDLKLSSLAAGPGWHDDVLPDWRAAREAEPRLFLAGGVPAGEAVRLTPPESQDEPERRFPESAPQAFFTWPHDAPLGAARMAISVHAAHLEQGVQIRLVAEERTSPPFSAFLWTPKIRYPLGDAFQGWLSVELPGDLAPPPGTRVRLEVHPFISEGEVLGVLDRVRLAWADLR